MRKVRCQNTGDEPLCLRFKGAGRLDKGSLCVLEALLNFRKKVAEKKDKPMFKVMSSTSLTKLTAVKPTSLKALKETKSPFPETIGHVRQRPGECDPQGRGDTQGQMPGLSQTKTPPARTGPTRPVPAAQAVAGPKSRGDRVGGPGVVQQGPAHGNRGQKPQVNG